MKSESPSRESELRAGAAAGAALALVVSLLAACEHAPSESETDEADRRPERQMAQTVLREARWENVGSASIERGMEIMLGNAGCRTTANCFACFQCHGYRGDGSPLAGIPRLTGQSYEYLQRALHDFASGRRENATMRAVVSGMWPQDLQDVSAYFAAAAHSWPMISLTVQSRSASEQDAIARGRAIATLGIAQGQVQPCEDCHGSATVAPQTPLYPYLAGQHPRYIEQQLDAFRTGERRGALNIMQHIAGQLTHEQMYDVAQYFGSLPPPVPRPEPTSSAAAARRR